MIRIHNFARGARGLRVMWLCEEMGVAYERVVVGYPPSEAYLALHPLASVPFLEDGDVRMSESTAQLLYVAERYGPTPLLPKDDPAALARALEMTVFSEASLGGAMNALMMAHFAAPPEHKKNWSVGVLEERMDQFLGFVEGALDDGRYLAGDRFTLGDIALATSFGIWRGALEKTLSPKLADYYARATDRPAYARARAAASGT